MRKMSGGSRYPSGSGKQTGPISTSKFAPPSAHPLQYIKLKSNPATPATSIFNHIRPEQYLGFRTPSKTTPTTKMQETVTTGNGNFIIKPIESPTSFGFDFDKLMKNGLLNPKPEPEIIEGFGNANKEKQQLSEKPMSSTEINMYMNALENQNISHTKFLNRVGKQVKPNVYPQEETYGFET